LTLSSSSSSSAAAAAAAAAAVYFRHHGPQNVKKNKNTQLHSTQLMVIKIPI